MTTKLVGGLPFAKLQLLVVEAKELISEDEKLPCLYCKISHSAKKPISLTTSVCMDSNHPKWYEEFILMIDDLNHYLKITVKEDLKDKSKKYGHLLLDLTSTKIKERNEEWYTLLLNEEPAGKIKLVFFLTPLGILPGNYVRLSRKLAPFRLDVNNYEVSTGGFLEGSVTLLTPKPIELNRIYLRIYGAESVNWTEEDWESDRHYTGETTLINKWYHGWENSQKTIDAGYYNWKYRIKVPTGIPPTYESGFGKISYKLFAFLDHDKFSEGYPLTIHCPSSTTGISESTQHKHNMQISCSLDKPVYFMEDSPIRLLIHTSIKNFSDYKIKSVKVYITEKSSYSANSSVTSEQKLLFKQHYRSIQISGRQKWEGKLLADLPVDYRTPTVTRGMGATRISCTQHVRVVVTKDTPLLENRVSFDLNLIISSRASGDGNPSENKKQLISLRKDLVVTSPPSPLVDRKKHGEKKKKT